MTTAATASDVEVERISHSYGEADVLHDVSLKIEHGELMTLLGPSGSGKSTLLRIIGGLERPRQGLVTIGAEDVTALPPERHEVGIVFQNYALFPHMTIAENIAFPLRMRKVGRAEAGQRTTEMLELIGLGGMGKRRPLELSGGQQQRVAVARALVFRPRVLLLDEPFGALDRRLREQLGLEVRRVQRELGITTVFVTHDQDEAFTMSTRIAVMGEGEILQVDTPSGIYRDPGRIEVARYLGHLNELPVKVVGSRAGETQLEGPSGLQISMPVANSLTVGRELLCGVRPEHLRLAGPGDRGAAAATVQAAIFRGDTTRAQVSLEEDTKLLVMLPHGPPTVADGDQASVAIEPGGAMLFDPGSGQRVA